MPIEVFYYGDQEMPHALASMLMDASLQPLTLADTSYKDYPTWQRPTHIIKWMPKIWALYRGTAFDEVLLLDADSVPLVQPEELFATPAYVATGSLFTPDYWTNWEMKDELYTTFGLRPPYEGNPNFKSMESGQLVFNRRKLSAVLEWVWFVNAHHDVTYNWMYGDKDSFRLAFALAGMIDSFSQSPTWPSLAMTQARAEGMGPGTDFHGVPIDYHHSVVVQYGWRGEPLFAHQLKFWPKVVSGPGAAEGIDVTRPEWVTVPSSHDRLFMLLELGCLGISKEHADDTSYVKCMARHPWPTASVNTVVDVCGWRDGLNSSSPIPLFPARWLGGLDGGLKALSETFKKLRPHIESARSEPMLVKWVGHRRL
ncbi:hypothetical protein HYH02_010372 [Chlamydomonas schloesseri]|uniref:Uncharacterized protein n=1 Tax=Chlamydomonas schloesseri TaxID=2026947 RepID=A0A835THK7_9CHLO|nr:hypothetical protein HYH02_010372 [Chlamydomonas schloesseri]|eukprot:KAG2440494.1 hypothetical protein HYH02_010372 [Chlamydomonas schloesseri]